MYKSSYTGSQIDDAVAKANAAAPQSTTYNKTEVDAALSGKANTSDLGAAAAKGFDAEPTAGNTNNAVSSDGVYQALEAKADKSIVGLKLVASNTMASSSTYTYAMNKNDFIESSPDLARSVGTYIISVMTWSTSPTYSLYAVSYTGGLFSYTTITKMAGADMSITVENGVISVNGLPSAGGKISIHALL